MKDYRNQRFGRLTVIGNDTSRLAGHRYLKVRCDCGTLKSARLDGLRAGHVKSCGCKKAEHGLKHGHRRIGSKDPTYSSWDSMWQRCTNPRNPAFKHYGGRGIQVEEGWSDFSSFLADMGLRPSLDYEIERSENDGDYCKSNCYWATRAEQMINTRRTVKVKYKGKVTPLVQLARQHGMSPALVRQRFNNGWSVERALNTPNSRT